MGLDSRRIVRKRLGIWLVGGRRAFWLWLWLSVGNYNSRRVFRALRRLSGS